MSATKPTVSCRKQISTPRIGKVGPATAVGLKMCARIEQHSQIRLEPFRALRGATLDGGVSTTLVGPLVAV